MDQEQLEKVLFDIENHNVVDKISVSTDFLKEVVQLALLGLNHQENE